jgi:hypothetical protein
MTVSALLGRCALGAAAVLVGLGFAGAAQAVPIYTYTFTQTNYVIGLPGYPDPGTVTGSFSGALDSSGHITRDTLTAYHFESSGFPPVGGGLAFNFNWSHDTAPIFFSYLPGDTSSFGLIDSKGQLELGGTRLYACIGAPTGFLCDGGNALGAAVIVSEGFSSFTVAAVVAITNSTPVLAGSVADVGDPVFLTATTPIPASLLLFATAFGGLSSLAIIRRRRQDPIAVAA